MGNWRGSGHARRRPQVVAGLLGQAWFRAPRLPFRGALVRLSSGMQLQYLHVHACNRRSRSHQIHQPFRRPSQAFSAAAQLAPRWLALASMAPIEGGLICQSSGGKFASKWGSGAAGGHPSSASSRRSLDVALAGGGGVSLSPTGRCLPVCLASGW